jgi:glucose/arabinose dehydrogenase
VYGVDAGVTDPVADLADRLVGLADGPDERGLLGIAAHPDGDRLFVRYSAPAGDDAPVGFSHTAVLASLRLDAPAEGVRVLLTIPQPQSNNNGGPLAFGPEGYLHVAVGDGGGGGDVGRGHAEDWYERVRGGNGQDVVANRLGSLLRIDVGRGEGYAVPPDNPLVGTDGYDEQYAWGFRHPTGIAFVDGSPVVADRGQERYEEVNVVERGGNYGWNVHEGPDCFDPSAPTDEPAGCPSHTLAGDQLLDPVLAYPHPSVGNGDGPTGVGVVGGHRYRGPVEELDGRYVFADRGAEGRLFVADPGDSWALSTVPVRGDVGQYVTGFARDDDALYVLTVDRRDRTGATGAVHRI